MPFSIFKHIRLTGISTVVPQEEISLHDELHYFGGDKRKADRMTKMVGLDRRRIAPLGITASDLSIQAAENLFTAMTFDRSSIDALIFVTQNPDRPSPATAFTQHKMLKLSKDCAVFDVNMACTAYIYGLWLASSLLESQAAKKVLLLVGDTAGQWVMANPDNRVLASPFGDGGSATILEYTQQADSTTFSIGSDGQGDEVLQVPGGGTRLPVLSPNDPDEEAYYRTVTDANQMPWRVGGFGNDWMDAMAVFNFTIDVVPPHIKKHLADVNMVEADIDYLVLHQANKQIVQNIAEKAGFPIEKTPWKTIPKYANQTAVSIPSAICDQLKPALEMGVKKRLLMCAFGSGLSWGSCIMNFDGVVCAGVNDFVVNKPVPTRKELIEYWHRKMKGS